MIIAFLRICAVGIILHDFPEQQAQGLGMLKANVFLSLDIRSRSKCGGTQMQNNKRQRFVLDVATNVTGSRIPVCSCSKISLPESFSSSVWSRFKQSSTMYPSLTGDSSD